MELTYYEPLYHSVISYLPVQSVLNLCFTCSRLALCLQDPSLWTILVAREFPWRCDDLVTPDLYKRLATQWTILRQPTGNLCYRISGEEIRAERAKVDRCEVWLRLPDGSLFLVVPNGKESIFLLADPETWEQSEILRVSPRRQSPRPVFSFGNVFLIGGLPSSRKCEVVSLAQKSVRSMSDLSHNSGEIYACTMPSGDIYLTSNVMAGRGSFHIEVIDAQREAYKPGFEVEGERLSLGVVPGAGEELVLISPGTIRTVDQQGHVSVLTRTRLRESGFPLLLVRQEGTYILAGGELFLYEKAKKSVSKIRVFATTAYVISMEKETERVEEDELHWHGH